MESKKITKAQRLKSLKSYKPTKEEQLELAKGLMPRKRYFHYKKLKSGKYKTYCWCCDNSEIYPKEEMQKIIASILCPYCKNDIITTKQEEIEIYGCILKNAIDHVDGEADLRGYRVYALWKPNKLKIKFVHNVLQEKDGYLYRKDISRSISGNIVYRPYENWKEADIYYLNQFLNLKEETAIYEYFKNKKKSKKEHYKEFIKNGTLKEYIKSNQKTLIMQNILNEAQVWFIIAFNLKSIDQVLKYRAYIRKNKNIRWSSLSADEVKLNEYYLNYLHKNKIVLQDFIDYVKDCRDLGIKVEKPKDFIKTHHDTANLKKIKEKAKAEEKISKRAKKLSKNRYTQKSYKIAPFQNISEIITCGDNLNNCISSYVDKYADGKTDLYYMNDKEKTVCAIEVQNKEIIQARANCNKKPTRTQINVIKNWAKEKGLLLTSEAWKW